MKKYHLILLSLFAINNSYAATKLTTPDKLKIDQLNKEEKSKLRSLQYQETVAIPKQYKGKLNFTEGREEVYLTSARMFFGGGGRYTIANDIALDAQNSPDYETNYFNKKNEWSFDNNFNFYASFGLYWRNGIRLEFEYSQMTLDTNNFASNFPPYGTTGVPFNQYLQKNGRITTDLRGNTILRNNSVPLVELSVKTYMVNFIFEKSTAKSKIRPYVGFGLGIVSGDMESLQNNGNSNVFGGQVMVGLSYPISKDVLVLYLGYRAVFSQEMEQTFTRITGVDGRDGNYFDPINYIYYNPKFFESKEKYKIQTHNIDFGLRFFF